VSREIINPPGLPAINPTYSQAIRANGFIFVAGQIGTVPGTGKLVSDDIAEQARQALQNTATILEAAGSSLSKVVASSLFLTEFDQLARINAVYAKYFPQDGPAKFACGVTALYGGAKFEIQVIALA
jgi:2-iminobutanoate/2-iminopropanoate deaminase